MYIIQDWEIWFFIGIAVIFAFIYGSKEYWRAKALTLEQQNLANDGWRTEALYLRHRANSKAAEFAEYN